MTTKSAANVRTMTTKDDRIMSMRRAILRCYGGAGGPRPFDDGSARSTDDGHDRTPVQGRRRMWPVPELDVSQTERSFPGDQPDAERARAGPMPSAKLGRGRSARARSLAAEIEARRGRVKPELWEGAARARWPRESKKAAIRRAVTEDVAMPGADDGARTTIRTKTRMTTTIARH